MVNFPNNKQPEGTETCGPVCVQNIFEHYNISKPLPEILKDLDISDKDPTFVPQLARYLKRNSFETIILSSSPDNFSPDWGEKPKNEVIEFLKEWVLLNTGNWHLKDALFLLFYLQEGGEVKQLDLSTKIIDEYLDKDYLVLACVDETWIWGQRKIPGTTTYSSTKGRTNGHFVVIYRKNNDTYSVSDPFSTGLPNRDGLYEVGKDKMLVAILTWAKQILALKK
jgi:hypothetical protein